MLLGRNSSSSVGRDPSPGRPGLAECEGFPQHTRLPPQGPGSWDDPPVPRGSTTPCRRGGNTHSIAQAKLSPL